MENDLIDLRFLRTPSTGSDLLDPYISPTKKNHFKRLQSFNICNRYNWISCFRPDSVQDWWTTHCPTWLGWSWTGIRIHLWMRHQAFQCCTCLWMKMMLLKLWKNLQVWVHLDTLYDVIKSGPKPEGQSISKHLNGRLEAEMGPKAPDLLSKHLNGRCEGSFPWATLYKNFCKQIPCLWEKVRTRVWLSWKFCLERIYEYIRIKILIRTNIQINIWIENILIFEYICHTLD